jgi:lambda repressor-like predicted transcriptional regulator
MAVRDKVKAALALKGVKIKDMAVFMGTTHQSVRNKLNRGYFTAEDLIRISAFLGAELSFRFTENQRIVFDESDLSE